MVQKLAGGRLRCFAVVAIAVGALPVLGGVASAARFAHGSVPASIVGSARRGLPTPCGGFGSPAPSSLPQFVSAIDFANRDVGWAVGNQIWATRNGGRTWQAQMGAGANLTALDVLSPDRAWAFSVQPPSMYSTADGGRHWSQLPEPPEQIDSVQFVSPMSGYAVAGGTPIGPANMPQCGGILLATSNGGRSWHQRPSPPNVQSACFSDRSHGWLSAASGQHADIYASSDSGRSWVLALPAPLGRRVPDGAQTGAALAQLQCAQGAVWAVYTGFGAAMSHVPWFAYHGSADGWQPVFSEGYTEVGLSAKFAYTAPAGYPGPFSALSATSAVFLGDNVASSPVSTVIDLATASGRQLRRAGVDSDVTDVTGVAFTSSADGWISGEHVSASCANQTGPSCPWVIDRTVDGGARWRRVFSYTP
ncbi:MAG TPA: hypothetical protein VFN61_05625 [Acidimicrobiales bacterium]|nr:hypothetical protein [Acidimicrobiales bacterium]